MNVRHFIYITTNLVSGKQYVGSHSTCLMDDGYLGSGHALLRAIKKYGRSNFEVKVLEFFDTKELMRQKLVGQVRTEEQCNNIAEGLRNSKKGTCPYCGYTRYAFIITRNHGEKCKHRLKTA